jgi:hypothetical protein
MRGWQVAALLVAVSALGGGAHAAGPAITLGAYNCAQERLYVLNCDERCAVQYPDRPKPRGFTIEISEDRDALAERLHSCKLTEVSPSARAAQGQSPSAASTNGKVSTAPPALQSGQTIAETVIGTLSGIDGQQPRSTNPAAGASSGPPVPPGPRLEAIYERAGGLQLNFNRFYVNVSCKNVDIGVGYTVAEGSGTKTVRVQLDPNPITLTWTGPEAMTGPPSVSVHGRVNGSGKTTTQTTSRVVQTAPACGQVGALNQCSQFGAFGVTSDTSSSVTFDWATTECGAGRLVKRNSAAPSGQ